MIDQEGIKSLEKGASNIRLTGNEGESSPIQEQLKKNHPRASSWSGSTACVGIHLLDKNKKPNKKKINS